MTHLHSGIGRDRAFDGWPPAVCTVCHKPVLYIQEHDNEYMWYAVKACRHPSGTVSTIDSSEHVGPRLIGKHDGR